MGNGEMVSANQTININPHGEMVKTPLINGDMVKDQLNISLSTPWIYSIDTLSGLGLSLGLGLEFPYVQMGDVCTYPHYLLKGK